MKTFREWLKVKLKNEVTDTGDIAQYARPVGIATKKDQPKKPKVKIFGKD